MILNLKNLGKKIYIFALVMVLVLTYSRFSVKASPQAITLEIELISKNYDLPTNSTHSYSNFSFSLISNKHYIFIASISGFLSNLSSLNDNISLIPQNHPPAIGLEPLNPIFLRFSTPDVNLSLRNEKVVLTLRVNFQLFVTGEDQFGKIETKIAVFDEKTSKIELNAPIEAVYYSISFPEDSTSIYGFTFSLIFVPSIYIVIRNKRKKNEIRNSKSI